MSIIKNEIPILEFDTDKKAILEPGHERLNLVLPEKCVFAFLGEHVDEYAHQNNAQIAAYCESATKNFPIYVINYKGEHITLCQAPVGAAAAAQMLDWLICYGVRSVIATGSCGCLESLPEDAFLIPYKALRDEGTSYHYAPPSRYIDVNACAMEALESVLNLHQIRHCRVVTWSTDGFFRETAEKVAYRRAEGCSVVEMECSALVACAGFRGITFGMLLYTADTLAAADNYDHRNWGRGSKKIALELCVEAVLSLGEDEHEHC